MIAPTPLRPYADEVGADPGVLRIGLLGVHPRGEFVHADCVATAPMRRAGRFAAFAPPFNISGQPAISVALYRGAEGLPIGVRLAAASGREDVLIRIAAQLESVHPVIRPPA